MPRFLQIFVFSLALLTSLTSSMAMTEEETQRDLIYGRYPEYPAEALKRRWTGAGMAIVDVDVETGLVIGVYMRKSTGHAMLDQAAIAAFGCWRFKPRTTEKQVEIPVSFTLRK